MNYLFTLKARVVLFALLVCHIGLKAQSTSDTVKSNPQAINIDTSLAKKAATGQLVKADTTLIIKAGATLVHRADTTMVIDPDGSLAQKFNEIVAAKQKADQAKELANSTGVKTDSASAKKPDAAVPQTQDNTQAKTQSNSTAQKTDIVPASTPPVTVAPVVPATSGTTQPLTTTSSSGSNSSTPSNSGNPPANTDAASSKTAETSQQPTSNTPQNTTQQVNSNTPQNTTQQTSSPTGQTETQKRGDTNIGQTETQQRVIPPADTSKKSDSATVPAIDTTMAKKADTTVKKTDTTTMKKDTAMMVTDTSANHQVKAQNGYLEVGGPGLAISVNYDARFHKERNGWGYRVGLGYFASGGNTVFTIPFQINYLYGEHSSLLELGAGTTFLNSTGTNLGNSKWEFDKVTGFIATATIGYRYQPQSKGINFRIAFVPILYDEGIIPAGGISIGYTFK